jgi:hypothetical protein
LEDGCDAPPIARNLCGKHYQRRSIEGTLPPKIRVSYAGRVPCTVRDCASHAVARTYCGRHARLANRYGLSAEQMATLPRYCEACGSGERLHVDHDHKTGVYRGVLCASCNTALGLLGEDVDRFLNLGRYLTRTR